MMFNVTQICQTLLKFIMTVSIYNKDLTANSQHCVLQYAVTHCLKENVS